ncbi:MAG: VOC family protein [Actinomycetota bacterium]|nr:VOC family protein [Actinomycetota bacterium]
MSGEAPTLYPSMRYRDAPAAIEFLKSAFGFAEHVVYRNDDGTIGHAELSYGPSILMLGSDRDDGYSKRAGHGWLYVAVEDADAHCQRARAAGAEVVTELHDTDYGSRDYAARDLEGNMWSFGTYRPGVEQV